VLCLGEEDMFDLITAGHFAIDLIFSQKIAFPQPTLGGPTTYVSLAARKLDAKVSVISKVGGDFPNEYIEWLNASSVDLSGLKRVEAASSTSFILKYKNGRRRLQLRSRAPPILQEDIPNLRARAIHVAPIANELSSDVVDKLRTLTDILSLDPQGFVRGFNEKGNMRLTRWEGHQILGKIDIYKSSFDEIKMVTGLTDLRSAIEKIHDYGAKVVIVTKGMKGSALFFEGRFQDVPACWPRFVQDLTGAGDAFIGAFLAEYIRGKDPAWCTCVGSAAASFVIEGVGPAVFGEKKETYMRGTRIYEKGLKLSTV